MEPPEADARPQPPREIEITELKDRERTPRERVADALLLAGIVATSCGLWLFVLLWLYSARHVVLRLF